MVLFFAVIFLFPSILMADPAISYGQGKQLSQSLDKGFSQSVPKDVPFNKGENVPETHYSENSHEMSEAAKSMTFDEDSEIGSFAVNSQKARMEEDYRVTEDSSLVRAANNIVADPMKLIGGTQERVGGDGVKSVVETTHICEESCEPATYTCEQTRHITLTPLKIKTFEAKEPFIWWSGPSAEAPIFIDPLPANLRDRVISKKMLFEGLAPSVIIRTIWKYRAPLSQENVIETIENPCEGYETQCNKGLCVYGTQEIVEGPETREFCDGGDCISVTRKWWRRRLTYHCKHPSKDNCGAFRSAGCDQIRAVCLERIGGVCVKHQKTFLCKTESLGNGKFRFSGDVPFCMDGNCDSHSWTSNKDFASAMAKMSLFREMGKDMNGKSATVFGGNTKQCSKAFGGFQDCCGSGGWGNSLSLGQNCSEQEKLLKKERGANKCVRVGTYCCEKALFGICLRKKLHFVALDQSSPRLFKNRAGSNWVLAGEIQRVLIAELFPLMKFNVLIFQE